jgi:glycosyltransferase involved in cell wall biosynthesis
MRFRRGNTTFHCVKTLSGTRAPLFFWLDTMLVARALKQIQPDLLHAWGTEFGAAAIAGRLGYPALVTMQGILTWYGSVFPLSGQAKLARLIEPSSLRKAHVVTCESSFGMRYLAERYPHLKLLQVEHAPSPLFTEVARRPQVEPIRILCVGVFVPWKGAAVVLKALEPLVQTVQFELIWIGARNPTLEQELRAKTGDELWKRVTFKHGLKPPEIAEELAKATIFLHAALADNSPNAVKEAVVAGVPVVATNTGGIPDYVFPEKNGYLFESGNAEDCCRKLQQALAHPLFGQGRVDENTLPRVRDYLSARMMAEKFKDGYAAALQFDPRARKAS